MTESSRCRVCFHDLADHQRSLEVVYECPACPGGICRSPLKAAADSLIVLQVTHGGLKHMITTIVPASRADLVQVQYHLDKAFTSMRNKLKQTDGTETPDDYTTA